MFKRIQQLFNQDKYTDASENIVAPAENSDMPETDAVQTEELETVWQALPETLLERIATNSQFYAQRHQTANAARSDKHLLWEIAAELKQAATLDTQAAEHLALQALEAEGDIIDDCLARTILIELYAHDPEREADYEKRCLETIDRAERFNRAWRNLQKQANPDLPDKAIPVPRLDAFEHLIRLYEARDEMAAACDIALRAQAVGYDEYLAYSTHKRHDKASRQSVLFLWALFAPGSTSAALSYSRALEIEGADPTTPFVLVFVLWVLSLATLFSSDLRQILLWIPRFLRRIPGLVWLILLEGVLLWLYQWEIQRFNVLQRNYVAWLLPWGLSLLLFAGVTKLEWQLMARRLSKSRVTGLLITLTTSALIGIGAELALRHSITFSNSYAIGLNHRRWMEQYELPQLNDRDYRDYPTDRDIPETTKRIIVTGDSFASGFGMNDIADTFPHLLDEKLGDDYAAHVLAKPGWDVMFVLDELVEYPVQPDLVIHSYFLNDIIYLSPTVDDSFEEIFADPPPLLEPLVDNFYLPEVLYWNIYRQWFNRGDKRYIDLITETYSNETLWKIHQGDMKRLINLTDEYHAEMMVLIWPILTQPTESRHITEQLANFFEAEGIPVVNMSDFIEDIPPMQRVVNPFDMHPGTAAHRLAADALYDKMRTTGLIQNAE